MHAVLHQLSAETSQEEKMVTMIMEKERRDNSSHLRCACLCYPLMHQDCITLHTIQVDGLATLSRGLRSSTDPRV